MTTVTTQIELDSALADPTVSEITIRSDPGVWLEIGATGRKCVSAFGSASVRAFGSASVSAFGSASVSAFDSASVSAFGSASVSAADSASVHGHGRSTINATSHVAVHLHSGTCQIDGGVLIDHTTVDQSDPATWCSYHGALVEDDHAVLYKAVRQDWRSSYGTSYEPGTTAACDDFRADGSCGGGLHLSPTPSEAGAYDHEATRYVEVRVSLTGINIIGTDKVKVASAECIREVDMHGRPVVTPAEASA